MPSKRSISKTGSAPTCPTCGMPVFLGLPQTGVAGLIVERPLKGVSDLSGSAYADRILWAELLRAGLRRNELRACYLWKHEPKEDELKWHLLETVRYMKGVKILMFLGSEVTQPLLGYNASDVSGVWTKSDFFPKVAVMPGPNPGTLVKGTVGEMRLAITRFAERMNRIKRVRQ